MPGCNLDPDGAQHPDRFISSRSPASNSLSPNQTNEIRFLVVRTTKKAICKPQNAAVCWCFVRCEGNMAKRDIAVHDRKVTAGFLEFSKSLVCTAMLTLYSPLSARAYNMESLRPAPSHQDCHCSSRPLPGRRLLPSSTFQNRHRLPNPKPPTRCSRLFQDFQGSFVIRSGRWQFLSLDWSP